jgi:thiamine-phosphate pyrophosphorylase
VLEDLWRFKDDRQDLATLTKTMRHELSRCFNGLASHLKLGRSLATDSGRKVEVKGEYRRADVLELRDRNASRVKESLRVLEEWSKLVSPEVSKKIEGIRYDFYHLEESSQGWGAYPEKSLYVLITQSLCRLPPIDVLEACCSEGATVIQLREKEMEDGAFLEWILEAKEVSDRYGVPLIVNDRVHLVRLSGVAGVHFGQGDLKTEDGRRLLKSWQWLGRSTHEISEAKQAESEGVDYIGVGPLFLTKTKEHREAVGIEYLSEVKESCGVPYVGIGSVNRQSLEEVLSVDPSGLAICTGVIAAEDPGAEVRFYKGEMGV